VTTVHFLSPALPEPHACGGLLCAECARHGFTAVHFNPDGICANGHRLDQPAADLTEKLAAWIQEQGIIPADSPEALAGRLLTAIHHSYIAGWLSSGDTSFLHARAEAYASPREQTDAGWAAENYRHGHGSAGR
jgi:hypothetical protein